MTSLDTGTYGAKVQSWRRANPRDLLKRLIDENPKATKTALLKTFMDTVMSEEGEDLLSSVIEYWFSNNYHSLTERAPVDKSAARARVEEAKLKIKERIHEEAQIILLDMILPNGKSLRASTGKDCAMAGGWFTKIASQVKPREIVGKVMSEAQLRKMYKE